MSQPSIKLLLVNTSYPDHYAPLLKVLIEELSTRKINPAIFLKFLEDNTLPYLLKEELLSIELQTMKMVLKGLNIPILDYSFDFKFNDLSRLESAPIGEMSKRLGHKSKLMQLVNEKPSGECIAIGNEELGYGLLPFPTEKFLDNVLVKYQNIINEQPEKIKKQFTEIDDEIGEYLSKKHGGVKAHENRFVKWLMEKTIWPMIQVHCIAFQRSSKNPFEADFYFEYDKPTVDVFDQDLHSYYAYRLKVQKEIETQSTLGNFVASSKVISNQKLVPSTFEDIFTTDIKKHLDSLRKIDPPVINDNNEWIGHGKQKSAIVAWVEVLEMRSHIKRIDRKILVKLIKSYFKVDISVSSFEKTTGARNGYHTEFTTLIK